MDEVRAHPAQVFASPGWGESAGPTESEYTEVPTEMGRQNQHHFKDFVTP